MSKALNQITTYDELSEWLLACMDDADDRPSVSNPSFTKEQMWNLYMKMCIENKGKKIAVNVVGIVHRNLGRDFKNQL